MIHHRLRCLRMPALAIRLVPSGCLLVWLALTPLTHAADDAVTGRPDGQATSQQPAAPAQNPPQQSPQQTPPPQQQNPPNPFENVPQAPEKPNQPTQPQNPAGIKEAKPAGVGENIIEGVEFRGQHKVPQDTLRALIYTKKGDVYDEEAIHRDFIAL